MKAYRFEQDRSSLSGLLFDDRNVKAIQLIPGTYDKAHLEYVRDMFPEAILTEDRFFDLDDIKRRL
jgi:hypothetical protein